MKLFLNDPTSLALQNALTGLSLRQQVISNNLANLNTPGFKAARVSFEAELRNALEEVADPLPLQTTHADHFGAAPTALDAVQPSVQTLNDRSLRLDGNNVDLERELAELTETVIRFQASTQLMARKIMLLRSVISGR